MSVQLISVSAADEAVIEKLSAFASQIVREHFDPIIGEAQNTYMIVRSQSVSAIRKQLSHGSRYYIAANKAGEWMGFMAFYPRGQEMYLSKFYVHKDHRGKGISRQMFTFILDAAKAEDLKVISLNVNRNNELAIAAYERMGFVRAREEQIDIGQGFIMDDYVYEYHLGT